MTIQQANQYFAALPDGFADPAQLGALLPASVQQVQLKLLLLLLLLRTESFLLLSDLKSQTQNVTSTMFLTRLLKHHLLLLHQLHLVSAVTTLVSL